MEEKKEQFEIRDLREKSKFIIDDKFLNGYARFIGIYAVGVYSSLCRHANKEQKCWPSVDRISEELDISRPKIFESIKYLEFWQIIIKKRVGKTCNNRYYLIDKKYWKPISEVNLINFTEVNRIDIRGKRHLLHQLTTLTSNSKETQVRKQKKGKEIFIPGIGIIKNF